MEEKKIQLVLPLSMVEAIHNIIADAVFRQKSLIVRELEIQTQNQLSTAPQNKVVEIKKKDDKTVS